MHRPLWQIFLTLFVLVFAVQRGFVGVMFYLEDAEVSSLVLAYGFQTLAGLATTLGLWMGRRWVLGALLVLGTSVAATAILDSFFLGVRPVAMAVGEVLVAALSTGALLLVLRREFANGDESHQGIEETGAP
jgi:hypothetical protein